jgi:hypothetical protein
LVQGECALAQGELAYVQGQLFVLFGLWIDVLCSLHEHGFVSDVSNRFPWSEIRSSSSDLALCFSFGFRSLVGVSFSSFFSFPFLFGYQILCVGNALIKWEIEDHVWFEDRWKVASWCDE